MHRELVQPHMLMVNWVNVIRVQVHTILIILIILQVQINSQLLFEYIFQQVYLLVINENVYLVYQNILLVELVIII